MIATVTLNPAIDHLVTLSGFREGQLNRADEAYVFPGGKGVNVSIILSRLGMATEAFGFLAGDTGKAYEAMLGRYGVSSQFVWLDHGFTRINTKITAGQETEINGNGPVIGKEDMDRLAAKLGSLKPGDYLVLSGNVPKGLAGAYTYLVEKLRPAGLHIAADTTGKELMGLLSCHPFLIKPNLKELEELCGISVRKAEDLEECIRRLRRAGAENILVSMGREGAVLFTADGQAFYAEGIRGAVGNTVGAGDSMLAGFLAGWAAEQSWQKALETGAAAGTATAFAFGLAEADEIKALCPSVTVCDCSAEFPGLSGS